MTDLATRERALSGEAEPGHVLLDAVAAFIARYVVFPSEGALTAVVLWVAHTHLHGVAESTPRLALLSPEPASGKTRALEVFELLVRRALHVLSASPAAIFRSILTDPPTLLFDECDAIFGRRRGDDGAEDLRALLNAGHRRGAAIPRCVGPTHEVRHFPVYAPVALAGLGDLPDTLMSRSIVVRMRRRAVHEKITPFRRGLAAPEGELLQERLAAWGESVTDSLVGARPEMPEGVDDRPADVWESLLAVSDVAEGTGPAVPGRRASSWLTPTCRGRPALASGC